jgi:uncharacterized protein YabE (DUF348 family)
MAGLCASLAMLLLFVVGVQALSGNTQAANGKVITIHDQDKEKVIIAKSKTVAEALKKAHISLNKADVVEPSLNTQIVSSHYQINVYRAYPVLIVDGLAESRITTAYQDPQQIAKAAHIKLYDEDKTTLSQIGNPLQGGGAGLKLTIQRATPFKLVLYGKKIAARTQAKTVGEMLDEKDVKLGKKDQVSVPLSTPIKKGMKVEVWRNGKQTVTREESVAFPVQQVQDLDRPVGYHAIQTPGVPGKQTVTYEIVVKNGKEVSKKVIQRVVTKQPQKQVEIVGAKPSFSGGFSSALSQLRSCEGSYTSNTGNGYYGAYQFNLGAWNSYKPAGAPSRPDLASPAQQDQAAHNYYLASGWGPWPVCGASLPDIYR